MKYAIMTFQGSTHSPNGDYVENIQILAFVDATNPQEAITVFEKDYLPDVQEKGFTEYSCFPNVLGKDVEF